MYMYIYIYLVGVVTGNSKSLCCRQDSVTLQDIAFLDLWAAWLKGFRLVRLMACTTTYSCACVCIGTHTETSTSI